MDASRQQPLSAQDKRNGALSPSTPRQSPSRNPLTPPDSSPTPSLSSNPPPLSTSPTSTTRSSPSTPSHSNKPSTPSTSSTAHLPISPIDPTLSDSALTGASKSDSTPNGRLFSDEVIYEKILRHMDWDGKYGSSPRRPFETFYFIQLRSKPQYQSLQSTPSEMAVFWNDDGSEIPATAILIPNQAQKEELKAWAKKQGSGGRLCPAACLLGGKRERVHGQTLVGV